MRLFGEDIGPRASNWSPCLIPTTPWGGYHDSAHCTEENTPAQRQQVIPASVDRIQNPESTAETKILTTVPPYCIYISPALLWHQKWLAVDCGPHSKVDKVKPRLPSKWLGFRRKQLKPKSRNLLEFGKKKEHFSLILRVFYSQEVMEFMQDYHTPRNSWTLISSTEHLMCYLKQGWQEKIP